MSSITAKYLHIKEINTIGPRWKKSFVLGCQLGLCTWSLLLAMQQINAGTKNSYLLFGNVADTTFLF